MSQLPSVPSLKIIGKQIKIGEKIGAGANGEVYVASLIGKPKHFPFPATFALKIIRKELCSAEFLQAVERELETGRDLQHPFIVQYIGSWVELQRGAHTGCYCLALHLCNGGDLHSLIVSHVNQRKYLSKDLVVMLMAHVFSALNYSHSKKVIHRDIKPANVFLVRTTAKTDPDAAVEAAMVGDYGLARPLEKTVQMVATRVGTPCYCSPEIVAGEPYTVKTDIFSAGVMFYELMMLERPFWQRGYTDRQTFYDILNKDPLPVFVQQCTGRYDEGMVRVVSLCLAKHEAARPSAFQVLTALSSTLNAFVLRKKIPVVEEKTAPGNLGVHAVSPKAPAKGHTAVSPNARTETAAAVVCGHRTDMVQCLVSQFRDVIPSSCDDELLAILNNNVEMFLLIKVLTATRAGDSAGLVRGVKRLLIGMDNEVLLRRIVALLSPDARDASM